MLYFLEKIFPNCAQKTYRFTSLLSPPFLVFSVMFSAGTLLQKNGNSILVGTGWASAFSFLPTLFLLPWKMYEETGIDKNFFYGRMIFQVSPGKSLRRYCILVMKPFSSHERLCAIPRYRASEDRILSWTLSSLLQEWPEAHWLMYHMENDMQEKGSFPFWIDVAMYPKTRSAPSAM